MKVTMLDIPCVINNNQPISVEFGDMVIRNIDGIVYEQDIPYSLDCGTDAADDLALRFIFMGSGAVFNNSLLRTTATNLGIQLKANRKPLSMNTPLNFTYNTKPKLSAVPVTSMICGVAVGEFSGSSSLIVEYQ